MKNNKSDIIIVSGGGGGEYYGGNGVGSGTYSNAAGCGGSSFINNKSLYDKAMYCYKCTESSEEATKTVSTTCFNETATENCAKSGNGFARISYLIEDTPSFEPATVNIVDEEKGEVTTIETEKNKEITLPNKNYTIISGEGTLNGNKLIVKSNAIELIVKYGTLILHVTSEGYFDNVGKNSTGVYEMIKFNDSTPFNEIIESNSKFKRALRPKYNFLGWSTTENGNTV